MIRRAWARFLDWLLGEVCYFCGNRVFPRDLMSHYRTRCHSEAPS